MNFFTDWFKKKPKNEQQVKREEQNLEVFLSAGKCKCGGNCGCSGEKKAEAPKPKSKTTLKPKAEPTAKKSAAPAAKPKVSKLEQVKADAERMAKKPTPKKPKAK